jgi:hypothetical protein
VVGGSIFSTLQDLDFDPATVAIDSDTVRHSPRDSVVALHVATVVAMTVLWRVAGLPSFISWAWASSPSC